MPPHGLTHAPREAPGKASIGRVHLEFVVTDVGPLPSAGVLTSPPEGRRPTRMTNSRCTHFFHAPVLNIDVLGV